jgi:chaperone required for assembly of F1-ATPase
MKRFFEQAGFDDEGAILLDGKPLNSPAKHPIILPNQTLAKAVAEEWNAQGEEIDKATLPLTGMASLALDIAEPRRHELLVELLEYGETDLMFYHALEEELAAQQRLKWQPWLNRAQVDFGTRYEVTQSIIPVSQQPENKEKHLAKLDELDHWQLAVLAGVVKPTTSLLLGWFFLEKELDATSLFDLSRLEESHNAKEWGEDADAKEKADAILKDLEIAQQFRDGLGLQ